MRWFWREAAHQRRRADLLYLRCEALEARLKEAQEARREMETRLLRERQAVETVVDNALFAAGTSPVFDPGHARFRPREIERQRDEARNAAAPLSPAEWRRKIEQLDREAAERDRKGRFAEELKRIAEETRHGATAET